MNTEKKGPNFTTDGSEAAEEITEQAKAGLRVAPSPNKGEMMLALDLPYLGAIGHPGRGTVHLHSCGACGLVLDVADLDLIHVHMNRHLTERLREAFVVQVAPERADAPTVAPGSGGLS